MEKNKKLKTKAHKVKRTKIIEKQNSEKKPKNYNEKENTKNAIHSDILEGKKMNQIIINQLVANPLLL